MVLGHSHSLAAARDEQPEFHLVGTVASQFESAAQIYTQSQPNRGYGKRLPCTGSGAGNGVTRAPRLTRKSTRTYFRP